MQDLETIISGRHGKPGSNQMVFALIADLGEGYEEVDFVYQPDDPFGVINPQISAWLLSNPAFEIGEYVPPPPIDPLAQILTKRQIVRAMIMGAGIVDPDGFVEAAIATMSDLVRRALALSDWRYAPYFIRTHDLFSDAEILAAAGMAPAQIDALWALGWEQPA